MMLSKKIVHFKE